MLPCYPFTATETIIIIATYLTVVIICSAFCAACDEDRDLNEAVIIPVACVALIVLLWLMTCTLLYIISLFS